MGIILNGLLWGLAFSFIFGQIIGSLIIYRSNFHFSFIGYVWFLFFIALTYLVYLGLFVGSVLALFSFTLKALFGFSVYHINLIYLALSLVFLGYFFIKWFLNLKTSDRPFEKEPVDSKIRIENPSSAAAYDLKRKVLFLGIDGCDWRLLRRFLDEDKLPNIKKLVSRGVFSELATDSPTDSPLIWNSIFTGKSPQEHGIDNWFRIKFPFLPLVDAKIYYPKGSRCKKFIKKLIRLNIVKRIPFSTKDRKVKAFWNILTDYNKRSINIGWMYSWPAEEIEGIQVSWYLYPFEKAAQDVKRFKSSNLPGRVYPQSLTEKLENFIVQPSDLTTQELESMYFPTELFNPDKRFADKVSPWDYAKDKTFMNIATYLLDNNEQFNLFSLYLYGIDSTCHSYWPFFEGATNNQKYKDEVLSVSEGSKFQAEAKQFGKAILSYYQYIDREVGKLLEVLGPEINLIIVSDHGFDFDGTAHDNSPSGVFIAAGPDIKPGTNLKDINIYDILPTLLTICGVPVAKDIRGRVIGEIFKEEFLAQFSPRYVESHQVGIAGRNKINDSLDESTRKGIENRLKALGYID